MARQRTSRAGRKADRVALAIRFAAVNSLLANERVARRFGLNNIDLQTLDLIGLREDVRTPQQIAEAASLPTSTVTNVLDRLEAAGFLRRERDRLDRRRLMLLVDERRAAEVAAYRTEQISPVYGKVCDEFSTAELEVVTRFHEQLSAAFDHQPRSRRGPELVGQPA